MNDVIMDLKGALKMVGQAQERVQKGQPNANKKLFKELGELYDTVSDLIESVEAGDYK